MDRTIRVGRRTPSEIACLANSPGRMRRTEVWISREEMVDFFEYWASSVSVLVSHKQTTEPTSTRTGSLRRDTLKDVVDKRVEDGHGLVGDTRVGVDLLEDWRRVNKLVRPKKSRN